MKKHLSQDDVVMILKRETDKAGSQKAYAAAIGVSAQYLSEVLAGTRAPGEKILKALGLRKIVVYIQAGSSEQ